MSLSVQIMDEMKTAMRAKDTVALEALRAIKSEILLAQTASGSKEEISEDDEVKLLQRLVKTRKESARIFTEQNRLDLAEPELAQIAVIEKFLPAQLSEEEVEAIKALYHGSWFMLKHLKQEKKSYLVRNISKQEVGGNF